jgi:Brp/Blh family beta-carotene 15,15'-monooxygenase
MRIFISLPIKPFIKALMLYLKNKGVLRYLFALITVIVFLLISRVDDQTAQNFNYLVLIFGFFSIGIPHGAVDHMLTKHKKLPLSSFILNYLLLIGAYLLIWYLFPVLSLFIFVAYSAFHFGESELIQNKEEIIAKRKYIKAFLLGLSILLFIVSTHKEESIAIISKMIGVSNLSGISIGLQTWSSIVSIASISYIVLTFLRSMSISSFGILILVVLGIQVPLSMAFGLYFIVQHSFNAWSHLKIGLNMNSRDLYLKSLPFTFGALLLFSVMIYFFYNSIDISGIWPVFFVFIACVSLPHFILMHLFYASK